MRRKMTLVALGVVLTGTPLFVFYPPPAKVVVFPDGKRFAFSIIDDTDMTTLERVRPVYELLHRYGLRTTKTVWVLESNNESHPANKGDTLRNPAYRSFIHDLRKWGFEIALHGVRGGGSRRHETLDGLDEYKREFGALPGMYINHSLNNENLYWGAHLFSFPPYRWAARWAIRHEFAGHDPASPYFWGDVAKQHVRYVRRFTFPDVNLLSANPSIPYRLPDKPYVNYWFPTANGNRIREFDELLKTENIEKLEREGGVCLVYAHLGSGSFNRSTGLDPRFEARIKELTSHNGWFATASEILDHLARQPGWTGNLTFRESLRLESLFVVHRMRLGLE